jgi:RNA polymerase sigma-70 factor (ECF subfamily)
MSAELDTLVARLRASIDREESARRLDALLRPRLAGYFRAGGFRADEAEELVQKTLARVFLGVQQLRAEASFLPWLFVIARNVARTERARQARERLVLVHPDGGEGDPDQPDAAREAVDASAHPVARELLAAVERALATLPEQQRRCLLLAARDGMAYEEIAQLLSLSPNTVRNHLAAARRRLRELLAASGGEPRRGPR